VVVRSNRAGVRNPVLSLPGASKLQDLPADSQAALRAVLMDISADAARRAEQSWRKHKGPMAAYWKAVSVYAKHTARALRRVELGGGR
jgi:hypothetical protein